VRIPWLAADSSQLQFPAISNARAEPNGLLCAGGDLSPQRLISAYAQGIFPWFNDGEPILWWSPDPRFVLDVDHLQVSKRDLRSLRTAGWRVCSDHCFINVLAACAAPRKNYPGAGTWLGAQMQQAYVRLHGLGFAHSVEIFDGNELIGGIYGVAVGRVFSGESMFGTRSNASKAAFVALVRGLKRLGFLYLDCQVRSDHLDRRGAVELSRGQYQQLLFSHHAARPWQPGDWPVL
jgi:leucyl/phenylalanyl-tRNA---protein transferase